MFESFFGFNRQPFQLLPDPSFYYGSTGHQRAYYYLKYGLYQGEGFIVLTGEVGAGKTTLIRNLLRQLDSTKVVAAQLVSTQLDADNLLHSIASAFGVPVREREKARIIATLEAYFLSLATEKKRALLIVDEAQNLTPQAVEELRMLSNLQLDERALLQSFLVGQPELRRLMASPSMQPLQQRVIASFHLGPLTPAETRPYVEHRLKHAGWKGDPAFHEATFPLIHDFAGGIPRCINILCTRLLIAGWLAKKHVLDSGDVNEVIAGLREEVGPAESEAGAPVASELGEEGKLHGLENRVLALEKAIASTLAVLRHVIRAKENPKRDSMNNIT